MDIATKEAVERVCLGVRQGSGRRHELQYHGAFSGAAKQEGDPSVAAALRLLSEVFSMLHRPDPKDPFMPLGSIGNSRTFLPQDLNDDQTAELESLVDVCAEPEFVSRIADVIWIRARKHAFARRAVAAYIEVAAKGTDSWVPRRDYLRRASQIAMQLGRKAPELDLVRKAAEEAVTKEKANCISAERGFGPAAFVDILIELGLVENWDALGEECLEIAKLFPLTLGCDEPRRYYELAATCFDKAKLAAKAKAARMAIAEHWEAESKLFTDGFNTAHRLEKAIEAYRVVGIDQAKTTQLMADLRRANEQILLNLKPIKTEVDVEPLLIAAREAMSDKTGRAALETFVELNSPGSYTEARASAVAQGRESPIHGIFSAKIMTREANVAARVPGLPDNEEESLKATIVGAYNLRQDFVGGTTLEMARMLIAEGDADVWQAAIRDLVAGNEFVPEPRREIFERALIAGLGGDGLVFTHLTIPQIENSIRRVFQAAGIPITSMDSQGVQEERDLNRLLLDQAAEDVLGQDFVWEMRALLIERTGPNLRNRLAHGLLDSDEFRRSKINALLWIVMTLLLRYEAESRQGSGQSDQKLL